MVAEITLKEVKDIVNKANKIELDLIKICSSKTQEEMDSYIAKFKPLIAFYGKRGRNYSHLAKQEVILKRVGTVENAKGIMKYIENKKGR